MLKVKDFEDYTIDEAGNVFSIRKNAIKNNLGKYHILASESAKKRVAKYDKNNNLIQVYNSITEASRKNNINITSISYSANGKRKTGGGYIWHFV